MKSQSTMEVTIIASFLIIIAIIFSVFYLSYGYNSAKSISISSGKYIENSYPLNLTHILLTINDNIPSNSLNISYKFSTKNGNITSTINYNIINVSTTQDGSYVYLLNSTQSFQYNPYNTIYSICDVEYNYENKIISILPTKKC
ncbi:MAG: hypothetical protein ACP5T6_03845 [Candidatus Micrarchaeia archaeon]